MNEENGKEMAVSQEDQAKLEEVLSQISEVEANTNIAATHAEILAEAIDELSSDDLQDDEFTTSLLARIEQIEKAMEVNTTILEGIESEIKNLEGEHNYTVADYIETKTDILHEKLAI